MNRCVILGGGGFIGSHLAEALVRRKYSVIIVGRKSQRTDQNLASVSKKITFIKADLNKRGLSKIIKKGDIVFDLVASSVPYSSMQHPLDEIKTHIFSHVQIIEDACKAGISKFIFFSSGGGIYKAKTGNLLREDDLLQPISPHAIGKVTIEHFLEYYCRASNIPYLIYRLSNPYGPRQVFKKGFGVIPTFFSHILHNTSPTILGNGALIRDFIYIDDVVDAILVSFHKKTLHHVYNIASGKGVSILKLWQGMGKITQVKLSPVFKPKRPIDADTVVLNTRRFTSEFDWKPKTQLTTGLAKTWNAFRTSEVKRNPIDEI